MAHRSILMRALPKLLPGGFSSTTASSKSKRIHLVLALWTAACASCGYATDRLNTELVLRGGQAYPRTGGSVSSSSSSSSGGDSRGSSRGGGSGGSARRAAVMLVRPAADHLSLQVADEGIAALEAMTGPVAPVVVIGPYRSGKSFLLNQLLGVGCEEGFGVGHTRDTQTKGIWVWGSPVPRRREEGEDEGEEEGASLVLMDTEGLESTKRIDTYDDRIFAFSAVVSSLLIYNLAEAVRESDVAKLSFATRLGAELAGGLQPNSMLWLIQRDFLGGKTVEEMLEEALAEVPNPEGDPAVSAVNDVRQSLKSLAGTSTAFGLAQPHLERTRLCELPDSELAPQYVRQRDALRSLVHRLAAPKKLEGALMTGPQLAELVKQVVKILNSKKIPTVHNVVEAYNSDVVSRCIKEYMDEMESLSFPVAEATLEAFHQQTMRKALERLGAERFGSSGSDLRPGAGAAGEAQQEEGQQGQQEEEREQEREGGRGGADELRERLLVAIRREHKALVVSNKYESTRACERLELLCEEELEALQAMRLPSERKFDRRAASCRTTFEGGCVGPSQETYRDRLSKAESRARRQFLATYNANMFQGMVAASLLTVAVFRFAVKVPLLELAGWVLFLGLEGSGQLGLGGGALYETRVWKVLLSVWEAVVFNPLVDLERHWAALLAVLALCWVARQAFRRRRGISHSLGLPLYPRQKRVLDRDMDV